MIPQYCITAWRQHAKWIDDFQIEQDLILSRALVNLYTLPSIYKNFAFRGGTALNKLYIRQGARYSEDIDLVQIQPEPIGKSLDDIRSALDPWLGKPTRKTTERSAKLLYKYTAIDKTTKRLKIEINTTEHFHILDFTDHDFNVDNDWFSGKAILRSYPLNELMGTKLRALYQRRKGRDLFDLWFVLKEGLIDPVTVIDIFLKYLQHDKQAISRALFEKNLYEKALQPDFRQDMAQLLPRDTQWSFEESIHLVQELLVTCLPGDPWKNK